MSIYTNGVLRLAKCVGLIAFAGLIPLARSQPQAPNTPVQPQFVSGAVRLPWSRGDVRYLRHWLALGSIDRADRQITSELVTALSSASPIIGAEQTLAGRQKARWLPLDSWTDVVDFTAYFQGPVKVTSAPSDLRSLFAWTSIDATKSEEAVILVGNEATVSVWLNGQLIAENIASSPVLVPDLHAYPVSLLPGQNRLLLRVDTEAGEAARTTVRVTPKGELVNSIAEITPVLTESKSMVRIATDAHNQPEGEPVDVAVLAPGGRQVAHAKAARGGELSFSTEGWAEGPYEFRCSTTNAWDEPRITFLPWYKGDILAAAAARLERPASGTQNATTLVETVAKDILRTRLDEVRGRAGASPRVWSALVPTLIELSELDLERKGVAARVRSEGFYRLGYIDPVDGSPQFCRAYLPPGYDAHKRWPLVIMLHGFNPPNPTYPGWWSVDQHHNAQAQRFQAIVLEPHGRGNAQYLGIGEDDVLRALAEAKRVFSVDEDRVYLTGESMGGSGTWLIGSRNAEQFAAIAPTFGGWDVRVTPPAGAPLIIPQNASQDFALERNGTFSSAEQLLNTPIFVHHGDSDRAVPVDCSRQIVRQLQRWGYDIRYREMPGFGHEDLGTQEEVYHWLLQHHRENAPRQVRVRAADLRGAHAQWLRVQTFAEPEKLIRADAEFIEPGVLRIDTDNVSSFTVTPPRALLAPSGSLRVVWNGQQVFNKSISDSTLTLSDPVSKPGSGLQKKWGMEGSISDVIRTPFVVVVGTTSTDEAMRDRCREKAEAFRSLWKEWQHTEPRVMDDTAITDREEQSYSLILIGGPQDNRVSQRLADKIPLTVTADKVIVEDRAWPAKDAVTQMIYPNPANTDRYILEIAATSADGMYFWNPALWDVVYGYPTQLCDWVVQDGHRAAAEAVSDVRDNFIASGLFDAHWHRDDRWTREGNPKTREGGQLRRTPSSLLKIDRATSTACEGVYQLQSGIFAQVSATDRGLELRVMGGAPIALHQEAGFDYAMDLTARPVAFDRDSAGRVTAIVLYNDAGAVRGKKLN